MNALRWSARGGGALCEAAPLVRHGGVPFERVRAGYNPDQPRDDDGKFGEGGGGSGGDEKGGKGSGSSAERVKESAADVKVTAREATRAKAKADKHEARLAAAQAKADKLEEAEEAARAVAEEADSKAVEAEEEADALEEWDADDAEEGEEPPPAEQKAEAHKAAREARAEARTAEKKADALDDRWKDASAHAEELEQDEDPFIDRRVAEHEARMAEVEHDAATLEHTLSPRERADEVQARADKASTAHAEAVERKEAAARSLTDATAARESEEAEHGATFKAARKEANDLYSSGDHDRGKALYREAARAHAKAERESLARFREASRASLDADSEEETAAEVAAFWAGEADEARDGDGDGRTGDEEERDDDPADD